MNKSFSVPRGTKDILSNECGIWVEWEQKSRNLLSQYGYREIRTPMYEETGLFKRSLGQSSEVVNKQLLELNTNKEEGLALRPEGTAPLVRAYNEHGLVRTESLSKLFYIGPMFRGERPQKGRLRQFHQLGAEAIGLSGHNPLLDAEMIVLAVNLVKLFGINNFKLKINSLGTAEDKHNFAGWLREQLKDNIGGLSEECQQQYEQNVFRLLDSKDKACRTVVDALNIDGQHLSENGRAYFDTVKQALTDMNIEYEVSAQLVRGLDYYTHTVFEISFSGLGAQDAIGAGGRYNGLVEQLGGGDKRVDGEVGAVGFALGIERMLLAAEVDKNYPEHTIDTFVIFQDVAYERKAFEICQTLRHNGISSDMDFGQRGFKPQMKQANKLNAQYVLILGENEFNQQSVAVKNMATGDQELVQWKNVVELLSQKIQETR